MKIKPFDIFNYGIMFILMAMFLFPFLYIISLSVSNSYAIARGIFKLLPVGFNLDAYIMVFKNPQIWLGYANSVLYSVTGTLLTLILCSLPGYVLASNGFRAKRIFTVFFAITMFFNGGIIPSFLVVRNLGLLDSLWAIIIPPALSAWNIILFRTNFKQVPDSLIESASIDGAGHWWIYARLIVPLSKPIFAVLSIFSVVALWNSYFPALLYLSSDSKQPLTIILRKYIVMGNFRGSFENLVAVIGKPIEYIGFERSLKAAIIMVSILPIVMLYPFMQRFLAKGILVGAIRG